MAAATGAFSVSLGSQADNCVRNHINVSDYGTEHLISLVALVQNLRKRAPDASHI